MAEPSGRRRSDQHGSEDLWNALHEHGGQIAEIAKGQAATDAQLHSLQRRVDTGFDQLAHSIESLTAHVNKPPQPTNWIGIGSLIVAITVVGGNWVQTRLGPIESDFSVIKSLMLENVSGRTSNASSLNWLRDAELRNYREHERFADQFLVNEERISKLEGSDEEQTKRIDDIDNYGSRVWNETRRER